MNSFNDFEHRAWEEKSHRYQDTWGTVTSQVINAALDRARIVSGDTVLDVGCGPGHLCSEVARRGGLPVGCDYSSEMVRIASSNYPQLRFQRGDAEDLPFSDESFDAVVLNYLLLHVGDQERVLREAWRVLKPTGRLVYTLWLPPSISPGLGIIFEALKAHADMSVVPPGQDIFAYTDEERVRDFIGKLGFGDLKLDRFETAWRVESPQRFFAAVQAGTRMGGLIELQNEQVKERIRCSIEVAVERFKVAEGYEISTPSVIVSASKISSSAQSQGAETELTLDLSAAPEVLFFFGLAGAGKSWVGDLVGRLTGWYVYHADSDLTDEMKEARKAGLSFSDQMRDQYFIVVADKIKELRSLHPRLVVTQAVYRQRHRDYLATRISGIEFLLVTASDKTIEQRLRDRGDQTTLPYARQIRANFEAPSLKTKVIVNESDAEAVIRQLRSYYFSRFGVSFGLKPQRDECTTAQSRS